MVCLVVNLQKQQNPMHCLGSAASLVGYVGYGKTRIGTGTGGILTRWNTEHWVQGIVYFVLFQFISDHCVVNWRYVNLMLTLLQFISGRIQQNPVINFIIIFRVCMAFCIRKTKWSRCPIVSLFYQRVRSH